MLAESFTVCKYYFFSFGSQFGQVLTINVRILIKEDKPLFYCSKKSNTLVV